MVRAVVAIAISAVALLPLVAASFCYFSPPQGWQCAQPKALSPHVQVGFIAPEGGGFHPSINLATEEVDVSLKEYAKAVKAIHLAEPDTQWRDLGPFPLPAGQGRLTEISCPSSWGRVKMLQLLFVEGKTAYVLTAAALQKEFSQHQQRILQSLGSLTLALDALSSLQEGEQRERLKALFSPPASTEEPLKARQDRQWKALQRAIQEEFAEMGSHWQFLVLKEGYAKIYGE